MNTVAAVTLAWFMKKGWADKMGWVLVFEAGLGPTDDDLAQPQLVFNDDKKSGQVSESQQLKSPNNTNQKCRILASHSTS